MTPCCDLTYASIRVLEAHCNCARHLALNMFEYYLGDVCTRRDGEIGTGKHVWSEICRFCRYALSVGIDECHCRLVSP